MNQNPQSFARHMFALARNLYEHGSLFYAFLVFFLALAFSDANDGTRRLPTGPAALATRSESAPVADAEWLNRQAERIAQNLKTHGIYNAAVYHRVKSPQSAAEKSRRQHKPITELNDLYGMRIVVSNELDVYRSLNDICSTYPVIPGSMKNYIETPKASGYQSVHVVTQIESRRVEFQIRTLEMHRQSEAEHEAYKARVRVA